MKQLIYLLLLMLLLADPGMLMAQQDSSRPEDHSRAVMAMMM